MMGGVNRIDIITNEYIPGSTKIALVKGKLMSNRLTWYGLVMKRYENHITKMLVMKMDR